MRIFSLTRLSCILDYSNVAELASAVDNADEAIKKACHQDIFCVLDTVAFADPDDTDEVRSIIESFNNDEGLQHELKQTETADIEIVEQVPKDLGNANCPTCKAVGWGDRKSLIAIAFSGIVVVSACGLTASCLCSTLQHTLLLLMVFPTMSMSRVS